MKRTKKRLTRMRDLLSRAIAVGDSGIVYYQIAKEKLKSTSINADLIIDELEKDIERLEHGGKFPIEVTLIDTRHGG